MAKNNYSGNTSDKRKQPGKFDIRQGPFGGIYLVIGDNATLLGESQMTHLKLRLKELPGFNPEKFKDFYSNKDRSNCVLRATSGFSEGDVIIAPYKHHVIVGHGTLVVVVDHYNGTRFVVALDDSKRTGRRRVIPMTLGQQLKAARKYIDVTTESVLNGLLRN